MKKIKKSLIVTVLFFLLVCGGCKEKIGNKSDEIRSYNWRTTNNDIYASLDFQDESAALVINSGGESCTICGLCIISDNTVVILDNSLKNEYRFGYTLSGEALTLEFGGEAAVFYKE